MSTGKAESRRAEAKSAEDRRIATEATLEAKKPTFFEKKAEEDFKAHDDWRKAKDYRKPPPGMISLGYGDVDQRKRMRERTFNMADTGLSVLGGAGNATALQAMKLNLNDEHDRDTAQEYERAVQAEDDYQRKGSAPQWGGMAATRSLNIAQLYNSNAQNSAQLAAALRPVSLLPGLISGGLSAAGSIATKMLTPCFPAGTLITVADGSRVPIEKVRRADVVLAFSTDGSTHRSSVLTNDQSAAMELVEIHLEGVRRPLRATPEHLISMSGGAFIQAGELRAGSVLHSYDPALGGDGWSLKTVAEVKRIAGEHTVYSLRTVSPAHTYFADCIAVHD